MRCAVCKRPMGECVKAGRIYMNEYAHGRTNVPVHTDQELADHMRAELVRRGYPDPWREREERCRVNLDYLGVMDEAHRTLFPECIEGRL